jgi:predicted enzyme related to lactoylglutathione lyase
VSVYIEVDDLQAYLDKAARLGGTTVLPPTDMGDFWIAMFSDPAGNVTGMTKGSGSSGS